MTRIGRYEIVDKLGDGSMGVVYRARDTTLDREVAVKVIRAGAEMDADLRERFYREARACAKLQHPAIVTVYDLGEADGTSYIAMELLRGNDFRKLIDARTPLTTERKLSSFIEVCEGLSHAHRNGIVHRDIKPSNIFYTEAGHAKVLDFGIARLPASKLTGAGDILGTPNYMAPEQILARPADSRSDLFSAAVVFFELLTYAHPFRAKTIPQRIVDGHPDTLSQHDPNLPPALDRIFARALARDPDTRYGSGDELAADFRAVAQELQRESSGAHRPLAAAAAETPLGEDPYEWRSAEITRLIPELEAAYERGEITAAKRLLATAEAIAAVDPRFRSAVEYCRERLGEAPSPAPPPPPTQTGRGGDSSQGRRGHGTGSRRTCKLCGASNRGAALFCIECGGKMDQEQPPPVAEAPAPPPAEPAAPPAADASSGTLPPAPPAVANTEKKPAETRGGAPWWVRPLGWSRGTQAVVLGATLLALALLAVAIVRLMPGEPVSIAKAIGTAVVSADRAVVYRTESTQSVLGTVSRGTRVNVLRLPANRSEQWIPVQATGGEKPMPPGFMRMEALEGWDSADPRGKLQLIRLFNKGEDGSEEEIDKESTELQRFIKEYPDTGAAREAQLELARLEIATVRRMRRSGVPPAGWQGLLDSAREHLDAASAEASLAIPIQQVRQRLNELQAEVRMLPSQPESK